MQSLWPPVAKIGRNDHSFFAFYICMKNILNENAEIFRKSQGPAALYFLIQQSFITYKCESSWNDNHGHSSVNSELPDPGFHSQKNAPLTSPCCPQRTWTLSCSERWGRTAPVYWETENQLMQQADFVRLKHVLRRLQSDFTADSSLTKPLRPVWTGVDGFRNDQGQTKFKSGFHVVSPNRSEMKQTQLN